jgi:hypothetical protein
MDEQREPDVKPDDEGRIRYGGGRQEGGGMVEPEEFADGGTDVLDEQPDHGSEKAVPTEGADPAG